MTILGLSSKQTSGLLQQPFQKLAKELFKGEIVPLQALLTQTATMETEKVLQTPTPAAQEKASEMPFLSPDCPRDPDYDADIGTDVITRLLEGT